MNFINLSTGCCKFPKKYIRILQETGMIEPSQNEGKKSTLKLSIDKIMRRYAEEKSKKTSQISV